MNSAMLSPDTGLARTVDIVRDIRQIGDPHGSCALAPDITFSNRTRTITAPTMSSGRTAACRSSPRITQVSNKDHRQNHTDTPVVTLIT